MDILYHTDDVLELRTRLWRIFLFMGIVFTIIGLAVSFFIGRTSTLECNRESSSSPSCTLSQSLVGFTLKEKSINVLQNARLVEERDSDDDLTYKIILETKSGRIPLTSYSSSDKQNKVNVVAEITTFLGDNAIETLNVQQGGKVALLLPLIFTLIGVLEIFGGFAGRKNIWHFDKVERLAIHNRLGLTGIKVTQYSLDDVNGAVVTGSRDSDGDTTYRIELTTNSGNRIPMTKWYSSGYAKKEQTAALLRDFLGETI